MAKNWTTNFKKRRSELELLLKFANVDIDNPESAHLQYKIWECLNQSPILHQDNKLQQQSDLMEKLRKHLQARLKTITETKCGLGQMSLWHIKGSIEFTLNPIQNCFQEQFKARKVKSTNSINVLRKSLDFWLTEIIMDLDFTPRRFGQCERCDAFFYNPTKKERIYCSTKCGNAVRQSEFRKKRREKK